MAMVWKRWMGNKPASSFSSSSSSISAFPPPCKNLYTGFYLSFPLSLSLSLSLFFIKYSVCVDFEFWRGEEDARNGGKWITTDQENEYNSIKKENRTSDKEWFGVEPVLLFLLLLLWLLLLLLLLLLLTAFLAGRFLLHTFFESFN